MPKPPKYIWIYLADTLDDGQPLWGVANDIDEIPYDNSGQKIARYKLERTATFIVSRYEK